MGKDDATRANGTRELWLLNSVRITECKLTSGTMSRFNQTVRLWQGLERYVLESGAIARGTDKYRLCVFRGPVFDAIEAQDCGRASRSDLRDSAGSAFSLGTGAKPPCHGPLSVRCVREDQVTHMRDQRCANVFRRLLRCLDAHDDRGNCRLVEDEADRSLGQCGLRPGETTQ